MGNKRRKNIGESIFLAIFILMKERGQELTGIKNIFTGITGYRTTEEFGEPFIAIFSTFGAAKETVLPAAYICSLFLSAIFNGFQTEKLHIFTRYARDNYSLPSFDCKMYEKLYASQGIGAYARVMLIDDNGHIQPRSCTKQDIFEAFDFYTNR